MLPRAWKKSEAGPQRTNGRPGLGQYGWAKIRLGGLVKPGLNL